MAKKYDSDNVVFLGVNVFEANNPDEYWNQNQYCFSYLKDADPIADIYDIPWQPAFVVLDKKGDVVLNQWGAPGNLQSLIKNAIEENQYVEI